jgi:hypothetical protein
VCAGIVPLRSLCFVLDAIPFKRPENTTSVSQVNPPIKRDKMDSFRFFTFLRDQVRRRHRRLRRLPECCCPRAQ